MAPRAKVKYYDDPALVGRRLRETREAAGLSQRELSFPGCTAAYISRIEKGERIPSLQLIREFAVRLGVGEHFISHGTHEAVGAGGTFVEARVAIRMAEFDVARELADALLQGARSNAERARACALFGEIELHTGLPEDAIDRLERAKALDANLEEHDPNFAEVLGRAYARANEYESSAAVFARNRDRAAEGGDALNEVRFASLLANAYSDTSNFSAAEEALARAINISDQVTDPFTRAKLLWAQSRLHALQDDAATAARYAERALEILEVADYGVHVGLAHQLLAHIELNRGNADRAIELLERGAPLVAGSGRKFELASLRIEQARALAQTGRAEEAASAAMEALGSIGELGSLEAGRCYTLIAEVYESLGDEERAIELYELAVEQLEAVPTRFGADAHGKLAELLEARGDKDAALAVLKRAMHLQRQAERLTAD
jgi:tetratricopeptide (TPR) repeat protein/DNA-binding XRE family transcriptional regulator